MAKLPHYTNSTAAVNKWEPVYTSLFEVTIIPPPSISGGPILLEHVNKITGLDTELGEEETVQKFKFAKRSFLQAVPTDTVVTLGISFSLNLNDNLQNYVYNTLRDWKRLGYNPLTGEQGLKKDYAGGKIIVTQTNRVGDIHMQRIFHDVFIIGNLPTITDLDYENGEAFAMDDVQFRSDYWTEISL